MTSKCSLCKENINREKIICYGMCERVFHARCIGVNTTGVRALNELSNLKYVCNECDEKSLSVMLAKVNHLIENMIEFKSHNQILTEAARSIKQINERIERTEEELRVIKNINTETRRKETYADKLKYSNEPVVLVVPKDIQTAAETKRDVKNKIDPTKVPIQSLRNATKGTIVLAGKSSNDVEEIKKYAVSQMGNKYDVRITELRNPKIKIVGLSEKLGEDVIINNMKAQNPCISDAKLKVITVYGTKQLSAIIEIDSNHFNKVMEAKRINIGWDRCVVYEYVSLRKCFNCNGYNHKAAECRNKKTCKNCSGEHDVRDCDIVEPKCINCVNVNKKLNLNFETNHVAHSLECKVFERNIESERKRIAYKCTK